MIRIELNDRELRASLRGSPAQAGIDPAAAVRRYAQRGFPRASGDRPSTRPYW